MSSIIQWVRNNSIYKKVRFLNPRFLKIVLREHLIEYALRGNEITCNVCGKSYITFLPTSDPPIFNGRCPNCKSMERTRLLWLYLNTERKDFFEKPLKVLHFAPEPGVYKLIKKLSNIQYTPCDFFAPGYSYPDDCINVDITNMQFEDKSFDVILCSHVLEHVPDDHKAMTELLRVLRPGGTAIIQVPKEDIEKTYEDFSITDPEGRKRVFGQWDHVRIYGLDFAKRLRDAGFTVDIKTPAAQYDHKNNPYGLISGEELFICTR